CSACSRETPAAPAGRRGGGGGIKEADADADGGGAGGGIGAASSATSATPASAVPGFSAYCVPRPSPRAAERMAVSDGTSRGGCVETGPGRVVGGGSGVAGPLRPALRPAAPLDSARAHSDSSADDAADTPSVGLR